MPEPGRQFYNQDTKAAQAKADAERDMLSVDGRPHSGNSLGAVPVKPHHSTEAYNISCADCRDDVAAGVHPLKRPKRS